MYKRLPRPVDSASSVNLHEPRECVSDAESKYSGGQMYFTRKTEEDNSAVGDIQLRKAKILESLKILENLTPGGKGKHSLLVIDFYWLLEIFDVSNLYAWGKISLNNK